MSDEILVGTMKALQTLGIRYPDEVSIISMSDGFYPGLYYPAITYIETSGYKLGKIAYQMMENCLADHTKLQERTVATTLVRGGSL